MYVLRFKIGECTWRTWSLCLRRTHKYICKYFHKHVQVQWIWLIINNNNSRESSSSASNGVHRNCADCGTRTELNRRHCPTFMYTLLYTRRYVIRDIFFTAIRSSVTIYRVFRLQTQMFSTFFFCCRSVSSFFTKLFFFPPSQRQQASEWVLRRVVYGRRLRAITPPPSLSSRQKARGLQLIFPKKSAGKSENFCGPLKNQCSKPSQKIKRKLYLKIIMYKIKIIIKVLNVPDNKSNKLCITKKLNAIKYVLPPAVAVITEL